MLWQSKNLHSYRFGSFLLRGGGGGGGDFHSEDFRFVLCIVQEAPFFISCDYVIKEFVVSIARISIRSGNAHLYFFFVRASTFEVPNVDKHGACSTHRAEYRESFLQKFQPLMQYGLQISFCHFWQPLAYAHLLHLLTLMRTTTRLIVNTLGMHLRFFHCFSPYACCYMLISPLVIPAAKHKIWYSYVVQLQTFSPLTRPHADRTNNCACAFRGYEMAKPYLRWRHECANLWDRNFPFATLRLNYTSEFWELYEVTTTT